MERAIGLRLIVWGSFNGASHKPLFRATKEVDTKRPELATRIRKTAPGLNQVCFSKKNPDMFQNQRA